MVGLISHGLRSSCDPLLQVIFGFAVLVAQAARNKTAQTGPKQQTFVLAAWRLESKPERSAGLVSGGDSLSGLQTAGFSHVLLGRGESSGLFLCLQGH